MPQCLGWCNKWTCNQQTECGGCSACGGSADSAATDISGCSSWCSEWTCNQHAECGSCSYCAPNPPPPPLLPNAFRYNPFISHGGWYVNPTLTNNLEATAAAASAAEAATLHQMMRIPSAFWIDNKATIHGLNRLDTLEGILQDAARHEPPPLCSFIFYDLPNRDCNAKASNGEISDATIGSTAALSEYKRHYVDPFVEVLHEFANVPVVLVVEPDSLGNVISNQGLQGCTAATIANYKEGVAYAVRTIATRAPHVAIYVDAAHGGWMGFEHNARAFVQLMKSMDVLPFIRGFSANVANYQSLGQESVCPAEAFVRAGQTAHGATLGVGNYCQELKNKLQVNGRVEWPSEQVEACCTTDVREERSRRGLSFSTREAALR